jgi:hypothetical protein
LTFFPPRTYHGEQKFHAKQIEAEIMPPLTSFGAWQLRSYFSRSLDDVIFFVGHSVECFLLAARKFVGLFRCGGG